MRWSTGRGIYQSFSAHNLTNLIHWLCSACGYTIFQALQFLPSETIDDDRWSPGSMFMDIEGRFANITTPFGIQLT